MAHAETPRDSLAIPGLGKKCVLLLSGGLDSTTVLALAKRDGWRVYALTMQYGQRHGNEIAAARRIASRYDVDEHIVATIDLRAFGASALTANIAVPKDRDAKAIGTGIPATYVPARNTIFLSFALAWAEAVGAADIFIGVNALDYSGYPDCRPEYIRTFETMANLATRAGVDGTSSYRVHSPLIDLGKGAIVTLGASLGVDFSATASCYDPSLEGIACGACDACQLRKKGFADAGIADPTRYSITRVVE